MLREGQGGGTWGVEPTLHGRGLDTKVDRVSGKEPVVSDKGDKNKKGSTIKEAWKDPYGFMNKAEKEAQEALAERDKGRAA